MSFVNENKDMSCHLSLPWASAKGRGAAFFASALPRCIRTLSSSHNPVIQAERVGPSKKVSQFASDRTILIIYNLNKAPVEM